MICISVSISVSSAKVAKVSTPWQSILFVVILSVEIYERKINKGRCRRLYNYRWSIVIVITCDYHDSIQRVRWFGHRFLTAGQSRGPSPKEASRLRAYPRSPVIQMAFRWLSDGFRTKNHRFPTEFHGVSPIRALHLWSRLSTSVDFRCGCDWATSAHCTSKVVGEDLKRNIGQTTAWWLMMTHDDSWWLMCMINTYTNNIHETAWICECVSPGGKKWFVCVQFVDIWEADAICDPFLVSIDNVKVTILLSHCPANFGKCKDYQGLSRISVFANFERLDSGQTWLPNCARVQNIENRASAYLMAATSLPAFGSVMFKEMIFFLASFCQKNTRKNAFQGKMEVQRQPLQPNMGWQTWKLLHISDCSRYQTEEIQQFGANPQHWATWATWATWFLSKKVRSAPWGSPGP